MKLEPIYENVKLPLRIRLLNQIIRVVQWCDRKCRTHSSVGQALTKEPRKGKLPNPKMFSISDIEKHTVTSVNVEPKLKRHNDSNDSRGSKNIYEVPDIEEKETYDEINYDGVSYENWVSCEVRSDNDYLHANDQHASKESGHKIADKLQEEREASQVTDDISFEIPEEMTVEDEVRSGYEALIEETKMLDISQDAAAIIVNGLLLEMCPLNLESQQSGGGNCNKLAGKNDYSHIDMVLPKSDSGSKSVTHEFKQFNSASVKIKDMLKKHVRGMEDRKISRNHNSTNIFDKLLQSAKNLNVDDIIHMRSQYNTALNRKNLQEGEVDACFSIVDKVEVLSEKEKIINETEEFNSWCVESFPNAKVAELLTKTMLVIGGAAEWKKSGRKIDFDKINMVKGFEGTKLAIKKGKKVLNEHMKNRAQNMESKAEVLRNMESKKSRAGNKFPRNIVDYLQGEILKDNAKYDYETMSELVEKINSLMKEELPGFDVSQEQIEKRIKNVGNVTSDRLEEVDRMIRQVFNDGSMDSSLKTKKIQELEKIQQEVTRAPVKLLNKTNKSVAFEVQSNNTVSGSRQKEIKKKIEDINVDLFRRKMENLKDDDLGGFNRFNKALTLVHSYRDGVKVSESDRAKITDLELLKEYMSDKSKWTDKKYKNHQAAVANELMSTLVDKKPFREKSQPTAEDEAVQIEKRRNKAQGQFKSNLSSLEKMQERRKKRKDN